MKTLEKLKLVALPDKASLPPAQLRREKFLTKLDEQIAMFKAEQAGQPYHRRKRVWVTDEDGNRRKVERDTNIRKWWWVDAAGVCYLQLRYGASVIELEKNKPAILVEDKAKLPDVMNTVREAADGGELDELLTFAAESRKKPLRKRA